MILTSQYVEGNKFEVWNGNMQSIVRNLSGVIMSIEIDIEESR